MVEHMKLLQNMSERDRFSLRYVDREFPGANNTNTWEAVVYINGQPFAVGYGTRKAFARDEAARETISLLIREEFHFAIPMSWPCECKTTCGVCFGADSRCGSSVRVLEVAENPLQDFFRSITIKECTAIMTKQSVAPGREWWREAFIYQIYPMSFQDSNGDGIGDLQGIIQRLDHLKWLGIDMIWLSPIYESPNRDMGYDISNYRQIDPRYGTLADMDLLLKELRSRDMKLMMDLVVNHTSNLHSWFIESRSSKNSQKRDWYIWRPPRYDDQGKRIAPNNWAAIWGGSAWEWDEDSQEYYLHLYLAEQPDLNWENHEVRRAVHDLMRWWLEKGVAGFRMDVINVISKPDGLPDMPVDEPGDTAFPITCANGPRVLEYLQEMNREVLSHFDTITVGETPWTHDPEILGRYVAPASKALDMVFTFHLVDLDGGVENPLKPLDWRLSDFKGIMKKWQTGMREVGGWNSVFIENHDQGRSVTRWGNDSEAYRSISSKMLAILHISQSGTVYIYQGQEIGMANVPKSWGVEEYKDVATQSYWSRILEDRRKIDPNPDMSDILSDIRHKARDNARTPMQWDDTPHGGFTSELNGAPWMRVNDDYTAWNAKAQSQDLDSVLHFWKEAVRIRKTHPVLVYGSFRVIAEEDERVFAFSREYDDHQAFIVLNFTQDVVEFSLPDNDAVREWPSLKVILGNYADRDTVITPSITLLPYEGRLYYI